MLFRSCLFVQDVEIDIELAPGDQTALPKTKEQAERDAGNQLHMLTNRHDKFLDSLREVKVSPSFSPLLLLSCPPLRLSSPPLLPYPPPLPSSLPLRPSSSPVLSIPPSCSLLSPPHPPVVPLPPVSGCRLQSGCIPMDMFTSVVIVIKDGVCVYVSLGLC